MGFVISEYNNRIKQISLFANENGVNVNIHNACERYWNHGTQESLEEAKQHPAISILLFKACNNVDMMQKILKTKHYVN